MAAAVFPWELGSASGKRRGRAAIVPPNAVVPFPLAMRISTRQYLWLRVCPVCGKRRLFVAQRQTCGNSCGVSMSHWRNPAQERRLRAMQKKATQVRLANMERRIQERIAGKSPADIYRMAYDAGYSSGHHAGRRGRQRLRDKARGVAC